MRPSALAYCAPALAFGALSGVESWLPIAAYPFVYALKIVIVSGLLIGFRGPLRDVRPDARLFVPAAILGLAVFISWIAIDQFVPYPHFGSRLAFDPFGAIQDPLSRGLFLLVRFLGLIVVVPIMEELFFRSFMLRSITSVDFSSIAIGDYSLAAIWSVAALSAAVHPEWLAASVASLAYTWTLGRTRSLFAVIVAHGSSNCALGAYIVATHAWRLW